MQDQILIEEETGEYVMKASFDDQEFFLKFYGNGERAYEISLFADCLVPLRDFINKYLDQACFSDQYFNPLEKFIGKGEESEQENP